MARSAGLLSAAEAALADGIVLGGPPIARPCGL
jgi:hypothetical protein